MLCRICTRCGMKQWNENGLRCVVFDLYVLWNGNDEMRMGCVMFDLYRLWNGVME